MIAKFCLLLHLVTKQISHQLDKNKYSNRTEKKKAVIYPIGYFGIPSMPSCFIFHVLAAPASRWLK